MCFDFRILALLLIALTLPRAAAAATYSEQVIYKFCSQNNCTDGFDPFSGVVTDAAGNLYGTTLDGGTASVGVVYALAPGNTARNQSVLHNFCFNCSSDGKSTFGNLLLDAKGNLYGTTQDGGAKSDGVVFELTPNGSAWTETILYNFCSQGLPCVDGSQPHAGLIMDAAGNLYGTTSNGGSAGGGGTVFELTPNGSGWTETVLYSFCTVTPGCADGLNPQAGLVMDAAGNLYGTTSTGGPLASAYGLVFELSPNAQKTEWTDEPSTPSARK
jgi:uncharacterized repeat protein (TIGR03803 family)